MVDGHVSRPWRRGPPQRVVLDRWWVHVVLDEVVRDRHPKVRRRRVPRTHAVQAT